MPRALYFAPKTNHPFCIWFDKPKTVRPQSCLHLLGAEHGSHLHCLFRKVFPLWEEMENCLQTLLAAPKAMRHLVKAGNSTFKVSKGCERPEALPACLRASTATSGLLHWMASATQAPLLPHLCEGLNERISDAWYGSTSGCGAE